METNKKEFKVVSRSHNANGFGLHGHILLARDGEAWEVARSVGSWNEDWDKGKVVNVILDNCNVPTWAFMNCEIPRRLPNAPQGVVDEVFA